MDFHLDLQSSPAKISIINKINQSNYTNCFRYLATGSSFRAMSYVFKRGETTIGKIIDETCDVIWVVLQPMYMTIPTTNDWLDISKGFLERWHLPHCIGAIDGKHVRMKKPMTSGSSYFNYKEYFSIHLMVCGYGQTDYSRVSMWVIMGGIVIQEYLKIRD